MSGLIDTGAWNRREHFELFRRASQPWFSITSDVDVTALRARCEGPEAQSFFLCALYACLRAANQTEAFRLRLRNDGVWLHDTVAITSTILREDETFGFGRFEMQPALEEFLREGASELRRVKRPGPLELPQDLDDGLIYHSTIPWLRFTAFANAITVNDDSVPRVVFGKCTVLNDRVTMPVSVEVHHAVVDGLDVARFFDRLQHNLDTDKKTALLSGAPFPSR